MSQLKLTFEQFTSLDLNRLEINLVGTDNEYGLKFTVCYSYIQLYKVQVKHPEIQTFYCARRYNEFYALHKVLKIKYSNLDLPTFPSKHELFNKVEKRRTGFHLLLNKLVLIANEHPPIAQNILKLLYFFLTRELSGEQKQHMLKQNSLPEESQRSSVEDMEDEEMERSLNAIDEGAKTSIGSFLSTQFNNLQKLRQPTTEDSKLVIQNTISFDYTKEIKNYSGNIYVRFSDEEEQQLFYAKIKSGTLQLFNHISQNYFSCQIFLFQAKIELKEDYILVFHEMDHKYIQIRIPQTTINEKSNLKIDFADGTDRNWLLTWYHQLRYGAIETLEQQEDFIPIGKVQLHIKEAFNLKNIVQDSFLKVRIRFKPFTCETKQHIYSDNPQWRQDFIMPIIDAYGIIYLELINEVQDGLLSRKIKQNIIGTATILIADILSYHSDTKFQRITLNLQTPEEEAPTALQQLFTRKGSLKELKQPQLVITIRNMSSVYSLFMAPPIKSYEGDPSEPDFTMFKMHIIRLKRIVQLIAALLLQFEDIVDQKYPKFTLFIFSIMFVFISIADLNHIMVYLVFMLIFIMFYQHPSINPIANQFMDKYFFSEISDSYITPQILTVEEKDLRKDTQSLDKLFKFEKDELQIDDEDEQKDKEGLYQKIRAIKKQFFVIQVQLTYLSNGAEKLINLFTWKEYQRTLYFLTIVAIAFFLIEALPLRYIMLAGIINEWFDGKTVFIKRQQHNYKIGRAIMEYIFKKHAPDFVLKDNYFDLEFPKDQTFRQKLIYELRIHLQVALDDVSKYQTANQIIKDLMTCSQSLKVMGIIDNTFVRDQLYYELRANAKYKIKPHYLLFYTFSNFLYNIPSQYYRLKHPRTLVK